MEEAKRFLSVNEVAKELSVSMRTMRAWIALGRIPSHRFGRAIRIARKDLERFVAESREGGGEG